MSDGTRLGARLERDLEWVEGVTSVNALLAALVGIGLALAVIVGGIGTRLVAWGVLVGFFA